MQPVETPQTIIVYVRNHSVLSYIINITDEETNVSETVENASTFSDGKLTSEFSYNFTEGRFYMIEIKSNGNVIYKGKMYSTSQIGKYNLLFDHYKQEPDSDSGYIVKP